MTGPDLSALKDQLLKYPGITSVSVDIKTATANLDYNPAVTGARTLINHLKQLGFTVTLSQGSTETLQDIEVRQWKRYFIVSAVLAFPVLLLSFVFPAVSSTRSAFETDIVPGLSVKVFLEWIFTTPIQIWVGLPLYRSAYKALRHSKNANMDTLVMISTSVAYIYSFISTIVSMANPNYKGIYFSQQ